FLSYLCAPPPFSPFSLYNKPKFCSPQLLCLTALFQFVYPLFALARPGSHNIHTITTTDRYTHTHTDIHTHTERERNRGNSDRLRVQFQLICFSVLFSFLKKLCTEVYQQSDRQ